MNVVTSTPVADGMTHCVTVDASRGELYVYDPMNVSRFDTKTLAKTGALTMPSGLVQMQSLGSTLVVLGDWDRTVYMVDKATWSIVGNCSLDREFMPAQTINEIMSLSVRPGTAGHPSLAITGHQIGVNDPKAPWPYISDYGVLALLDLDRLALAGNASLPQQFPVRGEELVVDVFGGGSYGPSDVYAFLWTEGTFPPGIAQLVRVRFDEFVPKAL